jgi:hypothetical protein
MGCTNENSHDNPRFARRGCFRFQHDIPNSHYLKLKYPEGEIDFIVSAPISSLPPIEKQIDLTGIRKGSKPTIRLDPPAEIALKKLHYRATMLKPRDVFDISVIHAIDGDVLIANLHEVTEKKNDLLRRLPHDFRRPPPEPGHRRLY